VTRITEGFNDFVTSTVAPVASGWSGGRVGFAPTGKAPPYHGARQKQAFDIHLNLELSSLTVVVRIAACSPLLGGRP
jgi:hypothetical protein